MSRLVLMCLAFAGVGSLSARTIALWPIEMDPATGAFDGRCAVNPDYSLYVSSSNVEGIEQGVGWNVPPNPEPETMTMFPAVSRTAVRSFRTDSLKTGFPLAARSPALEESLCNTNSFTVEGYIRFAANPSQTVGSEKAWCVILQSGPGSWNGYTGWMLSWRGDEGRRQFWLTVPIDAKSSNGYDAAIAACDAACEASLTNAWHHLALTHAVAGAASTWKLYLDGVCLGTVNRTVGTFEKTNSSDEVGLMLGGRKVSNNRLNASFDYWRVSDQALAPEDFLCAGGTGTTIPVVPEMSTDTTVAYWKLGQNADGSLDTWDYVGTADLHGGYMPTRVGGQPITNAYKVSLVPVSACAFSGNPPNPHASLGEIGNVGSLLARHHATSYTTFAVPDLGKHLEPATHSFTVEGYFKPRRRENTETQWLFATRDRQNGWGLQLANRGSSWRFELSAEDRAKDQWNPGMNVNLSGSADLSDWVDWKHVALVYEQGAGSQLAGQWRCYLDGELLGTVDARAWEGTTESSTFYLGGRRNAFNNFCGWIDCVRVSGEALAPEQFLCAADGLSASKVLAYWPLNRVYGSFDGTDVTGNYTLQEAHAEKYFPVSSSDAPVLTNPDRSPHFDGNAAVVTGSALFRDDQGQRKGASFETGDPNVCRLFSKEEYTFECWFKIDSGVSFPGGTAWDCLFLTPATETRFGSWVQPNQIFSYLPGTGFRIEDRNYKAGVNVFEGTGDQPEDVWRHLALTRGYEEGDDETPGSDVYRLYLDGVPSGAIRMGVRSREYENVCLRLGGRPDSVENTWRGKLSSVRISKGVLPPSRFLCATAEQDPEPVEPPRTIVYWPLDGVQDVPQVEPAFGPPGFTFRDWMPDGVTGVAEMAHASVPAMNVAFSRENSGAVSLAGTTVLRAPELGTRLSTEQAFTVEGWLRWDGAVRGGETVICGSYETDASSPENRCGWSLLIDDTGASARFGLRARCGRGYTPMASGVFADRTVTPGEWHYVALSYDPAAGSRGVWTLTVDHRAPVTLENAWRDATIPAVANSFRLGGAQEGAKGFSGVLDLWRVSSGVLAGEALLYRKATGFILNVR